MVFQLHNIIFYLIISLNLEISTFVNNCSTSVTYNPIKSAHAFIWVNVFIFILRSIVILNGHLYYNLIMGVLKHPSREGSSNAYLVVCRL